MSTPATAMAHYVRATKTSVVPSRVVALDTEAVTSRQAGFEVQSWRLGVSASTYHDSHTGRWSRPELRRHATPESLWQSVLDFARPQSRTVVVAHNLGYDLRLSRGLDITADMGWTAERLIVAPTHIGLDLVKGDCRVILVDSVSVLPASLEAIGRLLEHEKPRLPAEGTSTETWYGRCEADTEILLEAYLVILDVLRDGDLGCWARTGSGIGWNTYRRHHVGHQVLVHDDDELRALEHESAYGGRCEAWRHGTLRLGPYAEWDHELAYANVLSDESLPAARVDHVVGLKLAYVQSRYPRWRFLCRATVSQGLPILPTTDSHGIYWPIGTMSGWWWDCELLAAAQAGVEVVVHEAWRYKGEPWLSTWASFVLDACELASSPRERLIALCAKHWQRALVGRTAMRYRDWHFVGPATQSGSHFSPLVDLDTMARGASLEVGGRRWEAWGRSWGDQAVPQLHSAVLAHTRMRLWQAMVTAGLEHVVYVDTDALITDLEGTRRLRAAIARGELGSLRQKAEMRSLTVHAPRYITSSSYQRVAGVPKRRRQVGRNTFVAETWESVVVSLQRDDPGTVRVYPVVAEMAELDWRRLHCAGGATLPYVVEGGVRVTDEDAAGEL